MINIGIVIGVSSYANADDLPACQQDSEAVKALLEQSGRFSDILHINTDTTSSSIKSKLTEFARKHKTSEIGDAVFYFSGHGDFSGSDFSFILSDYDESKRNKTTLSNEELDEILRSIKPRLFVKVVDACQSGITYIKESEALPEYLKSAKGGFSNLYFMFSSKNDQASYASANLSHFTRSFLEASISRPDGGVRYKDVMDGISDSFSSATSKQTPYFVIQADLTEEFIDLDDRIRTAVNPFLASNPAPPAPGSIGPGAPSKRGTVSLKDRIAEAAKGYVSKAKAAEVLEGLPGSITKAMLSSDVAALYELTVDERTGDTPSANSIGLWIDQNPDDPPYFARSVKSTRTVTKRVPKSRGLLSAASSLSFMYDVDDDDHYKTVHQDESFVSGYKTTCDMPYSYLAIKLEPKYDNLVTEECIIAPIISSSKIRLFYAFARYLKTDFDKTKRGALSKWTTSEAMLQDKPGIETAVSRVMAAFVDHTEEPLRIKYAVEDENEGKGPEASA